MRKFRFANYEKRIEQQLPPISMCRVNYLERKYAHQLREIYEVLLKSDKPSEAEEFLYWMFYELFYHDEKYKICTIRDFESWIVEYIFEQIKIKSLKATVNGAVIEKLLIGGRMYRAWVFDQYSEKYFAACVDKLRRSEISMPLKIARQVFEDAENLHLEFHEDERCFLNDLTFMFNAYCIYESRPIMNVEEWEPVVLGQA